MQLLLGEGGAGLRGERGEEEGRVQRGEERRVRAGAQTPLPDPEVHGGGKQEATHAHAHDNRALSRRSLGKRRRREKNKNKSSGRRQLATSRPFTQQSLGGNPNLWKHNGRV